MYTPDTYVYVLCGSSSVFVFFFGVIFEAVIGIESLFYFFLDLTHVQNIQSAKSQCAETNIFHRKTEPNPCNVS